jgi:hypothetical protein
VSGKETIPSQFGLLIVCVIPGFTALHGLPSSSAALPVRELANCGAEATLSGFLYMTVEAITTGLIVSAVRWLVIDTLHHRTGLPRPSFDFASLDRNVRAFEFLVQNHYWYYQFYANMIVALAWASATLGEVQGRRGWGYLLIGSLFFLASRDALRKYYERAQSLLCPKVDAPGPIIITPD